MLDEVGGIRAFCATSLARMLQHLGQALHAILHALTPRCLNLNPLSTNFVLHLMQLMGKERNKPLAERQDKPLRYYDREVCKHNLCGLCPNTLFTNTKSYLGESACVFLSAPASLVCSWHV